MLITNNNSLNPHVHSDYVFLRDSDNRAIWGVRARCVGMHDGLMVLSSDPVRGGRALETHGVRRRNPWHPLALLPSAIQSPAIDDEDRVQAVRLIRATPRIGGRTNAPVRHRKKTTASKPEPVLQQTRLEFPILAITLKVVKQRDRGCQYISRFRAHFSLSLSIALSIAVSGNNAEDGDLSGVAHNALRFGSCGMIWPKLPACTTRESSRCAAGFRQART
jgi:hypothetical protein